MSLETRDRREKLQLIPEFNIYCASTSSRRTAFLKHCFPTSSHLTFFGGTEAKIPNVIQISKGKIDFVRPHMPNMKDRKSHEIAVLISADTATNTLSTDGNITFLENHGKPKQEGEIIDVFQKMKQAAQIEENFPYYQIISGSNAIIRNNIKEDRASGSVSSIVFLDPEKVAYFSTHEGFSEYCKEARKFFLSQAYKQSESSRPMNLTDVSGGISLPVLVYSDAVTAINDISREDPEFFAEFKKTLYYATVGFSPDILRSVKPDIDKVIDTWPWLNGVAQHAIGREIK
ncbi:MAG: Maf family protein [Candidatus Levybacteria bacterium]|nr:Maf family protein [Candidatus Levybacteria bacterium]